MYDNIGGKIKGLAFATFIVESISAIITGIALIAEDEDLIPLGLLILFCGPLVAWVSSWLLYGFGQLISKSEEIEKNTHEFKSFYSDFRHYYLNPNVSGANQSANQTPNHIHTPSAAPFTPVAPATSTYSYRSAVPNTEISKKCVCGERFHGDFCPNCGRSANDMPKPVTEPPKPQPSAPEAYKNLAPNTQIAKKCVCGERYYEDTCPVCGRKA